MVRRVGPGGATGCTHIWVQNDPSRVAERFFEGRILRTGWEERARALIRSQMKAKSVRYEDLAALLTRDGSPETSQNLRKKLARGSFTAAFLLQVLSVIGSDLLKQD
jgi:hypothetical protein